MRVKTCLHLFIAAIFALSCSQAFAQDEGHGHGRGHEKDEYREDEDRDHYYSKHDRDAMREWYEEHRDHLPPGLAERDHLPPGLERQLVVRGTLPPGLRKKMLPCPEELERRLPPPPPDCAHVVIGGHVVLLNRTNFQVMDIFHFEW
jgi:hypothetical protein